MVAVVADPAVAGKAVGVVAAAAAGRTRRAVAAVDMAVAAVDPSAATRRSALLEFPSFAAVAAASVLYTKVLLQEPPKGTLGLADRQEESNPWQSHVAVAAAGLGVVAAEPYCFPPYSSC